MLRLIVGLGNPGEAYVKTRHNVGFQVLQKMASNVHWETKFHGIYTTYGTSFGKVILLQPHTFMNRSGMAVMAAMQFFKLTNEQILVIHDELDLLPGVIRLKKGGGAAGHRGIQDIAHFLGQDIWRLRVGIGHPRDIQSEESVASYVLHPPSTDEQQKIEQASEQIINALPLLLTEKMPEAQQVLHSYK